MCIYLRPCNNIWSIGLIYVDLLYVFQSFVFVVQLRMGAGCVFKCLSGAKDFLVRFRWFWGKKLGFWGFFFW